MQCDEATVEGRKPATVGPRQLGEVAVGHLTVADDALQFEIGERDAVGPKFMPRAVGQGNDDRTSVLSVLPLPDEKADEAALGDRTGGERIIQSGEPAFCRVMMDVVGHDQCDQHVRVQKRRHS